MDNLLQMEMIPTPLLVPTTRQQLDPPPQTRPALPPHSAALHAVRKAAMKPGRRQHPPPLFRVYRADPWEFRHLVQRLTGAPQAAQTTSQGATALPPALAIDPTPATGLPPSHQSVQLQADDMASIESAMQLNIAPYIMQNMPSELPFDHDVVTSGVAVDGGLVRQAHGAVSSRQAAMADSSGAAEFWLTALYPESTFWSSLPTILSPEAVALTGHF